MLDEARKDVESFVELERTFGDLPFERLAFQASYFPAQNDDLAKRKKRRIYGGEARRWNREGRRLAATAGALS